MSILTVSDQFDSLKFSYELSSTAVLVFTLGDYPDNDAPVQFATTAREWFDAFTEALATCSAPAAARIAHEHCANGMEGVV